MATQKMRCRLLNMQRTERQVYAYLAQDNATRLGNANKGQPSPKRERSGTSSNKNYRTTKLSNYFLKTRTDYGL